MRHLEKEHRKAWKHLKALQEKKKQNRAISVAVESDGEQDAEMKGSAPSVSPASSALSSKSSSSSSSKPLAAVVVKKALQITMHQSLSSRPNKDLNITIAYAFASLSLPLQLIERPEFIHLVDYIRRTHTELPTKESVTGSTETGSGRHEAEAN